jgi:DNA-binding IclR family transcriptional regulator
MPRPIAASGAVVRALDVMAALRDCGEISIRDLSARVGLKSSTVHRLLLALESRRFVVKGDSGFYKLGPRLIDLGQAAIRDLSVRDEALTQLRRLAEATGEAAHLAQVDGKDVVFQECIEGTLGLRVSLPPGSRLPADRNAFGRVFLAHLSPGNLSALTARLGEGPERDRLNSELGLIRHAGVAVSRDDIAPGAIAVAAPVFHYTGKVVGSLGISAPTSRVTPAKLDRIEAAVRAAAQEVSLNLGYAASSAAWCQLADALNIPVEDPSVPAGWDQADPAAGRVP